MELDFNPKFGKYELLAHLATGGMAEIYLARMTGTDGFSKLVVVKRLLSQMAGDQEFVQMFLDEARINARLSHSNIVQVLELGEVDGQYFIAMEYVSGMSVAQVGKLATQRLGEVPQGVACGIVAQACAGLHHAHETKLPDGTDMGIIHRDVSPQNLLLTYEGAVKVVDFGIAKAEGRATQTRAGMVKGKFAYMSPEQCTGEGIDRRTDIFALGIILFELCTSRRLFKRATTFETYEAIIKCEVPDPSTVNPSVPKQVGQVILKALTRKKADRYPTAEAMQEELEVAMRRGGVRGSPSSLARFIEQNFADQIKEQEDLIRRIESGELSQPEHEHDAEASQIAQNYNGGEGEPIDDIEPIEEADDGPTQNEEADRGARAKAPAPPPAPAVASLTNQNAPLANLPVSMALPIIDAKQAIKDMLEGRQPNILGSGLSAAAQQQHISGQGPAPAPASATSGATLMPTPSPGFTPSGQLPAPPSAPGASSAETAAPPPSAATPPSRPQRPQTPLEQLANLPLTYLVAIGCVLALVAAAITALILF